MAAAQAASSTRFPGQAVVLLCSWRAKLGSSRTAERKKLSHAAEAVNRECGTEGVIGVGSGELLN
jgi:hypothetical protein